MQEKPSAQPKKSHRGRRALTGLLLLAVVLTAAAFWQRENLQAVCQFLRYSKEELEQQLVENEESAQALLQKVPLAETVLPEAGSGPITPPAEIAEPAPQETPPVPSKPAPPASNPSEPKEPPRKEVSPAAPAPAQPPARNYEQEIAALVAQVYQLRVSYTAILDEMHYDAMVEYYTQLAQDRPKSDYLAFLSGYASQVTQMEKDCDRKIDGILTEMRALLKESGQSSKLADEVAYTYAHEKSTKKALYMSELKEKGLI